MEPLPYLALHRGEDQASRCWPLLHGHGLNTQHSRQIPALWSSWPGWGWGGAGGKHAIGLAEGGPGETT